MIRWMLQAYDVIHNEFTDTGIVITALYGEAIALAKPHAARLGLGEHWCLLQIS